MKEHGLDKIRWEDPKKLKPDPKNRNTHSKDQIDRLAKIIQYQGWRWPILVSNHDGKIKAGHGRVLAAIQLKMDKVPVVYQDFIDDEQAYAFMVADNSIASWAELDLGAINVDLGDLGPDFDIDLLGIKDFALEPAEKVGLIDDDEVPEHVEPKTKLGDIYKLGNHRLMCGDSTSIDAVEKLMAGEKADMIFTDPPYDFETEGGGILGNSKKMKDIKKLKIDKFDPSILLQSWSDTHIYYCNRLLIKKYIELSEAWGVSWDLAISHKTFAPANWGGHLQTDIEYIMILGKQAPNKGLDAKDYSKLCSGKKDADDEGSAGWAKPVWQCEKFIRLFSQKSVLDLFGGSGSTLIACEKTNRKCFMMELDPHYCDIIVARWEKFTGKTAELT